MSFRITSPHNDLEKKIYYEKGEKKDFPLWKVRDLFLHTSFHRYYRIRNYKPYL
jgi:hypothetical protein